MHYLGLTDIENIFVTEELSRNNATAKLLNSPRRGSFDPWIKRFCLNRNESRFIPKILINLMTNYFEEEYSADCFYDYCYLHDFVNL